MTIYLDIIFIENLLMNYIIIFTTGFVQKNKMNNFRIIIASIMGSIYAVIAYVLQGNLYSSVYIKIILSVIIVFISFNAKSFKILGKQIILFYLISFAFGGCAFALLYFISPQNIVAKNGLYVGMYPFKTAILSAIVAFIIILNSFKIIKQKFSKTKSFYNIEIFFENKKLVVKALLDTGNMLKEPITGVPVIIIEDRKLKKILPDCVLGNVEKIIKGEFNDLKYIAKLKIIPFSSLGKQNGLLLGFKVDRINILCDEENIENIQAIIGIYDKELGKNDTYSALIGLDVLERGQQK